ncbi:DUF3348 domain-containing protein [Ideonella sp. BN130291]|uniref:DUF3348 domain-containing protein n=1 Tax=Ideonella sp. BN130291 TaxID=3112940 RepID=UPI002E273761|nr:DUF3348 domain-containing protein [Ideonella sp. BN130291]
MLREPPRTRFTGPALIRLLTQFGLVDAPESTQGLADGLSQWLAWTDAIALSAALDGGAPAPTPAATCSFSLAGAEREFARVRTTLAEAIDADFLPALARPQRGSAPAPAIDTTTRPGTDYAPYRQRHLARQKAIEAGIARLRGQLRGALAGGAPPLRKLAAVDAVLEQVVGAREQHLLSKLPSLLERHFERLRRAAGALAAPGVSDALPAPAQPTAPAWLDVFHKDLHQVLLAELELRLQPAEGLLDALRSRQPAHHE